MKAIFEWNDDCWPTEILVMRPSNMDKCLGAQRGCFTFHPPIATELKPVQNFSLISYTIPAKAKAGLLQELDLLGVDEFEIFGDFDHLAERLKRAYRNF